MNGPPEWVDGEVYLPLAQATAAPRAISLAVRIAGDSAAFERRLPAMIGEICGNCAVSKIARMDAVVANAEQAPRSMAWLVGGFALLALGMAFSVHAEQDPMDLLRRVQRDFLHDGSIF